MTAFKVYHTCREHKEGLQKLVGWRELHSMNGKVWGRDSLEKGKDLANSYTATRVNVYFKLSSFSPILF